ncbi:hypothetical protein G6F65_010474 [Rhizopus arrhizus]|nr:hypothetical protein G6F65_010474 [Rhizopus arrhizus]
MPATSDLLAFALISLGMVLTPGPNMIYLVSRSICQGRRAGLISLGGVALGFVFYMLCAALGITALLMTVPLAYDALRIGGALYLLYLAWQALKPGGRSPFAVRDLPPDERGDVPVPAAAVPAPGRPRQRAGAVAGAGLHPDCGQRERQRGDRGDGRQHRRLPGRAPDLAGGAALADGHGAGGAGGAYGGGGAALNVESSLLD